MQKRKNMGRVGVSVGSVMQWPREDGVWVDDRGIEPEQPARAATIKSSSTRGATPAF